MAAPISIQRNTGIVKFISTLSKAAQRHKKIRAFTRPTLSTLNFIDTALDGDTAPIGIQKSSNSFGFEYTGGTGNVLDRLMRYKEYDLMMATETMCNNAIKSYADNATRINVHTRNVIDIQTNDDELKDEIEELLFGLFDLNHNARNMIRKMCKYGDHILIMKIDGTGKGIVDFIETRITEMDRRDYVDENTRESIVEYYWRMGGPGATTTSMMHPVYGSMQYDQTYFQKLDPLEVVHFCLDEETDYLPFGKSILESARYTWKQLRLMEEAMLVYRIVRAPERRVFHMETGNLRDEQIPKFIEDTLSEVRREAIVDPNSGDINLQFNVANTLEDFVLVKKQGFGSSIEVLPGGQNTDAIQDVEYFRSKTRAGLGVPKAFLEYDENLSTARGLSLEDFRFAASISFIQGIFIKQIQKIIATHLLAKGWTIDRIANFKLKMENPSNEDEKERLSLLEQKANLYNNLVGSPDNPGVMSPDYVRRNIFNLTDVEIGIIKTEQLQERRNAFIGQQITANGNFNSIFPDFPEDEDELAAPKENMLGIGDNNYGGGSYGGGGGFNDMNADDTFGDTEMGGDDINFGAPDFSDEVDVNEFGDQEPLETPEGGVETAGYDPLRVARVNDDMISFDKNNEIEEHLTTENIKYIMRKLR